MSSTAGNEGLAAGTRAQPRLQRNALSLFETISATLANLAPAEGIFLSVGLTVAFMGSKAPWAFLIAMVAVFTLGNTMSEFSRVRPSAGSFVSYIGNALTGYSPSYHRPGDGQGTIRRRNKKDIAYDEIEHHAQG